MGEVIDQEKSYPPPQKPGMENPPPAITAPPLQLQSPPMKRSQSLDSGPFLSRMMSNSLANPMKKAAAYLEKAGSFTKLNPHDAWLPITESRNGNAYYCAFHTLSSGIGFQALVLPLAFTTLGWVWGIICLSTVFIWQMYTLWLLIQLHESQSGVRYSRYLQLSMAAFGPRLGKVLALFPIMYLSGGSCVTLIMFGGGTMRIFFQILCGDACSVKPPTLVEWYLIFACSAVLLAQFPNLNSIAGVSLVGAVTAVGYCTLIWVLSVFKGRPGGVSYDPLEDMNLEPDGIFRIFNALGIIAFAFRGHNLVLEIQGTMPSNRDYPSRVPMWRGVMFAYLIISMCLFPLAIGGYWVYGDLIPQNGGMLNALYQYHRQDTSNVLLGLATLLVIINSLTSFQIYAMPVFDNLEFRLYTSKRNGPCPRWLRSVIRVLFGCFAFFVSVALPFLPSLAGLIGGIALPITLAYPCLMWVLLRKPRKYGLPWWVNWVFGISGMVLSVAVVTGAIWDLVTLGIEVNFFHPK